MDIEKTMEFILEQQAVFASDMSEMRERTARLVSTSERTLDVQEEHRAMLRLLADAHQKLADSQEKLAETMRESERRNMEAHDDLRETINVLIRFVQDMLPRLPKQ